MEELCNYQGAPKSLHIIVCMYPDDHVLLAIFRKWKLEEMYVFIVAWTLTHER